MRGDFMKTLLKTPTRHLPKVGGGFSLEVEYPDPIELVTSAGLGRFGWKFLGPLYLGRCTLSVELKSFGCVNRLEAEREAEYLGYRLLEGQACRSLAAQYTPDTDNVAVHLGGSQWQAPSGSHRIIRVYNVYRNGTRGFRHGFYWAVDKCDDNTLWLVTKEMPLHASQLRSRTVLK
jgi:hypothetical protein